ncbi:MAG: Asd/ArgC dimerization domain-containing protein [Candidatus Rokubacteria bacterium]|nr:Asd/ArgC dimerization domain-containing protein [Candidatus Rokubacteria bacterium]
MLRWDSKSLSSIVRGRRGPPPAGRPSIAVDNSVRPARILAGISTTDAAKHAMREFGRALGTLGLPSAPRNLIIVHDDPFRPQPRLDRDADGGMATSVGRVRADAAIENGLAFVLVSHNTKMGAAKGAVLVAEHLASAGYV